MAISIIYMNWNICSSIKITVQQLQNDIFQRRNSRGLQLEVSAEPEMNRVSDVVTLSIPSQFSSMSLLVQLASHFQELGID